MPDELLQGRWARANLRVCSMLMAAVPEFIKADILSRKCVQSAPSILFRLHICQAVAALPTNQSVDASDPLSSDCGT